MANSLTKTVQHMLSLAEDQGFRIKEKKSGYMVLGDSGQVMLHRTLSDQRGVKNARARLRGIGVAV